MKIRHFVLLILLLHCSTIGLAAQPDTPTINRRIEAARSIKDNDSAIALYYQILQQSRNIGYDEGVLQTLNLSGNRLEKNGQGKQAMQQYLHGLELIQKKRLSVYYAMFYTNMGTAFFRMGNYDSAIHYYHQSITAQQKDSSVTSLALPYLNLGLVYNNLSRYDKAIDCLKKAAAFASRNNDTLILAGVLQNIGVTYTTMNNKDSFHLAEKYLNEALSVSQKNQLQQGQHNALSALGTLADAQGDIELAIHYYKQAAALSSGNSYDDLIPFINLGYAYYKQKEYEQAQQTLEDALQKIETEKLRPDYLYNIYAMLAKVYREKGLYKKAADFYERYIELYDSVKGDKVNEQISQLQLKYETVQRDNELIKKELLITRQQSIIQKKTTTTYLILFAVVLVGSYAVWYFRRRQRIQKQQEERAVWQATMQGEEKERARLARELHDHIGGSLSNARMWFATIQKQNGYPHAPGEFDGALQLLDDTLTEVRDTAHHLMPELVLRHGLVDATRMYCSNVERAAGINIKFHYLGFIGDLDKNLSLMLYRTIQELIQNAVKHSDGKQLLVQLSYHDTILSITIEDDGKGFDYGDEKINGTGLQNIRHNITNINGQFNIRSVNGKGTSICIEVSIEAP
jgi:two-component system NarL family sensor kinase